MNEPDFGPPNAAESWPYGPPEHVLGYADPGDDPAVLGMGTTPARFPASSAAGTPDDGQLNLPRGDHPERPGGGQHGYFV